MRYDNSNETKRTDQLFHSSFRGTMHAVFTPIVTTAAIISEEKEKNTLRALIMSNVKPLEYLLSIGGFVFICTNATGIASALLGGFSEFDTVRFMLYMMLGSVCSIILGSAIGVHSKNMMSANAMAVPLGMAFAFLPMLASFNETIRKISRVTYGQQISNLMSNPSNKNFSLECCLVISINLVILITAFVLVFSKNRLED